MNPRLRAYTQLLIVSIIWGVAGVVIKFTLQGFDPLVFLTYRFAISVAIAIVLTIFVGLKLPKDPKLLGVLVLYGLLTSTLGLGLLFFGYDKTTAIDATLISATAPIFVSAAGVAFLKEHVTLREKIGISIAFVGTAVTILEPILKNGDGYLAIGGNLLVLSSILVGVATAVIAKIILRDNVSPLTATNASFFIGLISILPIVSLTHTPANLLAQITSAPLPYHLGVIFMAALSGNLAYTLWHKAQKTIEIGEVSLFTYLYPIFATPLAVLWLKEKVTIPFILGAAIIAAGVVIAEKKRSFAFGNRSKSRYN
jgi:drug/metabolite transporter (DMT)-like permease